MHLPAVYNLLLLCYCGCKTADKGITIDAPDGSVNVDDILETVNHFRCIDLIIDQAKRPLTEALIKQLHLVLKSGTTDSRKSWFAVGAYKRLANEVGARETTAP